MEFIGRGGGRLLGSGGGFPLELGLLEVEFRPWGEEFGSTEEKAE